MAENTTFYELLGVRADATLDEIRRAHRKGMRTYHPDLYAGRKGEAEERAAALNHAYSVLSDPSERARYDAELRGGYVDDETPADAAPFEDTWGHASVWDEEVVDEEVVEDSSFNVPPPRSDSNSMPPGSSSWSEASGDGSAGNLEVITPITKVKPGLKVAWGGVLMGLTLGTFGPTPYSYPVFIGAVSTAVVGLVIGAVTGAPKKKSQRVPRVPLHPQAIALAVVLGGAMLGLVSSGFTRPGGGFIAAASAFIGMHLLVRAASVRSMLSSVVTPDSLRDNNTFGNLPGGVAADMLNQSLSKLYDIPTVRIMRCSSPGAMFTHAIMNGNRVVFVGSATGRPGTYRWSGPSLLREGNQGPGSGIPEEVLRGHYQDFLTATMMNLPVGVQLGAWVLIHPQTPGQVDYNDVGSPKNSPLVACTEQGVVQIGQFLTQGQESISTIDQETFVKTLTLLVS